MSEANIWIKNQDFSEYQLLISEGLFGELEKNGKIVAFLDCYRCQNLSS